MQGKVGESVDREMDVNFTRPNVFPNKKNEKKKKERSQREHTEGRQGLKNPSSSQSSGKDITRIKKR